MHARSARSAIDPATEGFLSLATKCAGAACGDPYRYEWAGSEDYRPDFCSHEDCQTVASSLCFRRATTAGAPGPGRTAAGPLCQGCFDDEVLDDNGCNDMLPDLRDGPRNGEDDYACECGMCRASSRRRNESYSSAQRAEERRLWSANSSAAPSAFDFIYGQ